MTKRENENREWFVKNLKYYRTLNHYTQRQLAGLIGKHHTLITKIEKGQVGPSFDTLSRIAEAFHIHLYKLLEPRE